MYFAIPKITYYRSICSYCFESDNLIVCNCSLSFCKNHLITHCIGVEGVIECCDSENHSSPNQISKTSEINSKNSNHLDVHVINFYHPTKTVEIHCPVFHITSQTLFFVHTHHKDLINPDDLFKILKLKNSYSICEHVKSWEEWIKKQINVSVEIDNKVYFENIQRNKIQNDHTELEMEEEQTIKCKTCDHADCLICLYCFLPFCGFSGYLSTGKGHMLEHYKKTMQMKSETMNVNKNYGQKYSEKKLNNSDTTMKEIERKEKIENVIPKNCRNISHNLAIRDMKIFCYGCDDYTFSAFLYILLAKEFKNPFIKILRKKYAQLCNQNQDLYMKQKDFYEINEKQQEILFNQNDAFLYTMKNYETTEQNSRIMKFIKNESIYIDHGILKGISNKGNTCYINAMIQLLSDILVFEPTQNEIFQFNHHKNNYDIFKCIDCQLIKAIKSVRHNQPQAMLEHINLNMQIKPTENTCFENNKSEQDGDEISNLLVDSSIQNSHFIGSECFIQIDDLLKTFYQNGLIIEGMQQDSTELLFCLFSRIQSNNHYKGYEEMNKIEISEKKSFQRNEMSTIEENSNCILNPFIIRIKYIYHCNTCKTSSSRVQNDFFTFKNITNEQIKCEKCGLNFQIETKIYTDKYILMVNCYWIGDTFFAEKADEYLWIDNEKGKFYYNENKFDNINISQQSQSTQVILEQLKCMGFDEGASNAALVQTNNDVNESIEILLNDEVNKYNQVQKESQLNQSSNNNLDERLQFENSNIVSKPSIYNETIKLNTLQKYFLKGGIKFNFSTLTSGHYIYISKIAEKDFVFDDKKVVECVRDEKYYNNFILMVYERVKNQQQ